MSIRPFVILAAAIAVVLWMRWAGKSPPRWLYSVGPLSWLLHVILFFTAAWLALVPAIWLNMWSGAVYIHGVIMVTAPLFRKPKGGA